MALFKKGDVCVVTREGNTWVGQVRLKVGDLVAVQESESASPWVTRVGKSDGKMDIAVPVDCLELYDPSKPLPTPEDPALAFLKEQYMLRQDMPEQVMTRAFIEAMLREVYGLEPKVMTKTEFVTVSA
jgi:hypothetical protein